MFPSFECSDARIEQIYRFRAAVFQKHIKQHSYGHVVTEFLSEVPWAGKANTISCAAGHHFYEGRWLSRSDVLEDYAKFWFKHGGEPRMYSFWAADSIYAMYAVTGDSTLPINLLDDLIRNYEAWEKERFDNELGLFWQIDGEDGMEFSIGGSGCRVTINSYMYGEAIAISRIAKLAGREKESILYLGKAQALKAEVQKKLWDSSNGFFKTLSNKEGIRHNASVIAQWPQLQTVLGRNKLNKLVPVRELQGLLPWYFLLPDDGYEEAWHHLFDAEGFKARYGPTTAERRDPYFMYEHPHECLWNGPSWPYATSQTLDALANVLNEYDQSIMTSAHYYELLQTYTNSQWVRMKDTTEIPWIDENLHPDTGEWLARARLYDRNDAHKDRGRDYNHSAYCDHIITGLAGIRPSIGSTLTINPLISSAELDYFRLKDVHYHGRNVTVSYDASGEKYGCGKGLSVWIDGTKALHVDELRKVSLQL
ncbi:MGH1-like glycoside hydrolase domain-containing protein [Paenibacillus sp. IITD108]|uniref:MGH1-like glycoside hydrolase domain-containing protein n=1 Tax=Paenibacillus sp. IITD108 TaxID=3116649 RepID=UPI002F40C428